MEEENENKKRKSEKTCFFFQLKMNEILFLLDENRKRRTRIFEESKQGSKKER